MELHLNSEAMEGGNFRSDIVTILQLRFAITERKIKKQSSIPRGRGYRHVVHIQSDESFVL